jgi:retron-type reverse transcriptase
VYIEKADGRQRPLGVAALEDKIVQHAVVTILNQIYEEDFLGFCVLQKHTGKEFIMN